LNYIKFFVSIFGLKSILILVFKLELVSI